MKRQLLPLSALLLISNLAMAQVKTVTFKPGAAKGQDVSLWNTFGVTLSGDSSPREDLNEDTAPEITYMTWTWGGNNGVKRCLIRFADMDTIPASATIVSAQLKLFGVPSSGSYGTSYYPGSPYPETNEGWLSRVTGSWDEALVTWNTQPGFSVTNQVAIPYSASHWSWNYTADVTKLVKDMRTAGNNYGFMMQLQTEAKYRAIFFASSDHSDPTLWPELVIQYTVPTSGIGNLDMSTIKVFPNPAAEMLLIEGVENGATLNIYSTLGQLVQSAKAGTDRTELTLSGLASGPYTLQVTTADGKTGTMVFNKK